MTAAGDLSRRMLVLTAPVLWVASYLPARAECAAGYAQITVPLCQPMSDQLGVAMELTLLVWPMEQIP
jgi:hypothetical protein